MYQGEVNEKIHIEKRIMNNVPRVALIDRRNNPIYCSSKIYTFSNHFGHVLLYLYQYSVIRARSSTILHFSIFAFILYFPYVRLSYHHAIFHRSFFYLFLVQQFSNGTVNLPENKFKNFFIQFLFPSLQFFNFFKFFYL